MTELTPAEIAARLPQFTGSETWTRHGLNGKILLTDGAMFVAESCGAHWLLNEIVLFNAFNARVKAEDFQVWRLEVDTAKSTAVLTMTDGDGGEPIARKRIPFTDFPLPEIELWFSNSVLYLPSEH